MFDEICFQLLIFCRKITGIAEAAGILEDELIPYGSEKAKVKGIFN